MPVDTQTPGSPGWWLKRLGDRLLLRRPHYDMLESYAEGTQAVPALAGKATRQAFRDLMEMARMNYGELVVEAVRERMSPLGFRTGGEGDDLEDTDAWRIWQANALDADCSLVHRASLTMGAAYVIVGAVQEDTGAPLITPEDPREVITEQDPTRRRKVAAGLKLYRDSVKQVDRAFLFLPGEVHRYARPFPPSVSGEEPGPVERIDPGGWDTDGMLTLPDSLQGAVPVVPFLNLETMFGRGRGEFEKHRGVLDRISFTVLQRLEVSTLQAFRQRAIKGVDPTDEDGNRIDYSDIFTYDPGALWLLPETAELWESGQVDLTPIRMAIRDDVQDLAAVTRTPLFYLTPDANNGSAEGASLAREGLTFKTADRIKQAGEAWEQVMSLAFRVAGDTVRGNRQDLEVIWADPQRYSLAERYDAAVKAQAAGVPWRTVMQSVLQFSPQQVDRMEAERATDTLLAEPAAPERMMTEEEPAGPTPQTPAAPPDDTVPVP